MARAITISVMIDGERYQTDVVGDPDDIRFAVLAGRAVSDCIVGHERRLQEKQGD